MKKFLLALMFVVSVSFVNAQLGKIPADVTDAFAQRYPHATKVEWRNKIGEFVASFQLNGSQIMASFNSDGDWQSSERVIDFNDLPVEVQDGFTKSKYADWQKKSIVELQINSKPLQYKISVSKTSLQKKNLFFDADGKMLKENISL